MSRFLIRILKVLLPLVVVVGAGLVAYGMFLSRPPVETQAPVIAPPSVRVQRVTFDSVTLTVTSQGTVQPRTSSQLVPEISGPVIEVAPSFAVGGFFEAGDVLLRIDPYDYQQAVITGRSQVAQAELRLAQEEAEAEVARREWQDLGRGDASALTLRQPQLEDARASVASAEAALDRAARDLERADVKAPYAGRVQSKDVDVGQFVNKGNTIAHIYAVDSAEIRLPLPDEELAYVNVPLSYRGATRRSSPRVTISSNFAGREHTWDGRIVRTEGEIDPVSRMVHVVAEVRDPYAPGNDPRRPPLSSGMFVEAEITGSTVNDVVILPWAALRGRDQVLIVDEANRLRFRDVEILRSTSDEVLIRAGLAEGELVCISPLDTVTDGMVVRVVDDDLQLAGSVPAPANTPAAAEPPGAVAPPDAEVADAPPAAPETDPVPALQPSDVDATQSRDDQINAIRQELARLTGGAVSSASEARSTSGAEEAASEEEPAAATQPERRSATAAAGRPGRGGGRGRGDAAPGVANGNNRAGGRRERGRPTATAPPAPGPAAAPAPAPAPAGALNPVATTMAPTGPRVALLPFLNLSRDPADADLGGTLTTALHAALMDGGTAGVVPLTTTDSGAALEDATTRNARWLVGGGFQRMGDQLRITARVRDVPGGAVIASLKEDGNLADLDMLTSKMIAAVRASLVTDTPDTPAAAGPIAATPAPREAARTDAAPAAPRRRARSVAIGPFANISRNPDDDGLGENMVEALVGWLGQLQNVSVVSLDAVSDAAAMDAATEQNATWLIGGGYQRVGDQVRITARLIDVASGALLHTVKTDGGMDEMAILLAEVVSAVQVALAADNSQALLSTTLDEVAA
jgi:multidrug efflux system membrane fusion protein